MSSDPPFATVSRPPASSPAVSARMSRLGRRDTAPELLVRSALHRRGLRFRVQRPLDFDRRRRADIVFARERVAVFVDGCFWHRCPDHATFPRANAKFWEDKLQRNVDRDRDTDARLAAAGWTVIRVWEHERPEDAADRIGATVMERRRKPSTHEAVSR
jgi:DNA mismatch endonuclease, patch repair protein